MKKKKLKENSTSNNFSFGIPACVCVYSNKFHNLSAESKKRLQEASSFIRDLFVSIENY